LSWKLFWKIRLIALNRFCEWVLAEVTRIAHLKAYTPHQRYLPVFQLVKQRYRDFAELFDRSVDPPLDHKRLFFI
jgi:hypothetical protein